jgi:hypothetical protein
VSSRINPNSAGTRGRRCDVTESPACMEEPFRGNSAHCAAASLAGSGGAGISRSNEYFPQKRPCDGPHSAPRGFR